MFQIFDALVGVASAALTVVLGFSVDTPIPPMNEVAYVSFKTLGLFAEDCTYTGIVTPYVRDWEEVVDNGYTKTVNPPDLTSPQGFAVVLTTKKCEGKPQEQVAFVGVVHRASWIKTFYERTSVKVVALQGIPVELRPQWLPQVSNRVEARAAAGDMKAKEFLDSLGVKQVATKDPTP